MSGAAKRKVFCSRWLFQPQMRVLGTRARCQSIHVGHDTIKPTQRTASFHGTERELRGLPPRVILGLTDGGCEDEMAGGGGGGGGVTRW